MQNCHQAWISFVHTVKALDFWTQRAGNIPKIMLKSSEQKSNTNNKRPTKQSDLNQKPPQSCVVTDLKMLAQSHLVSSIRRFLKELSGNEPSLQSLKVHRGKSCQLNGCKLVARSLKILREQTVTSVKIHLSLELHLTR